MNPLLRWARNGLWWTLDYAYAARWQLRAALNRTDPASFASGSRVPVVVLPGVYESWKFLQPLIEALHERGHPVHVVDVLHNNLRPLGESADAVARFLEDAGLDRVVLVAHSKGGLTGKLVMMGDAGERITGMLAVATPFQGSRYARLMPTRTLRAFSPADAVIVDMSAHADANARITSVFGVFDPHIPEGSELPGARNVRLATGGHFRILAHPQAITEFALLAEER